MWAECSVLRVRGVEYHHREMADERERTLQEQLEEIGAQLDWVRGYL